MRVVTEILDAWLRRRLPDTVWQWLAERRGRVETEGARPSFLVAFGAMPRKTGREDLALTAEERAAARAARPGWLPDAWSLDQVGRTRLVLALPSSDEVAYRATLDRLFEDADLGESVALYQALPLLPHPERHRARAAEGIRSNMKAVFDAVALDNPYPAEQLDAGAFNQLVLKCLFLGSPLHRVAGLDARGSPELAAMLGDYAHERWAAGRPVPLELWRLVGPYATDPLTEDLRRVLRTGSPRERLAVALACAGTTSEAALRQEHPEAFRTLEHRAPTWQELSAEQETS